MCAACCRAAFIAERWKTTMKVRRAKDGRGAGRGDSSHRNLCKEFVSRLREESALFGSPTNPPPPRVLAAANQWGIFETVSFLEKLLTGSVMQLRIEEIEVQRVVKACE